LGDTYNLKKDIDEFLTGNRAAAGLKQDAFLDACTDAPDNAICIFEYKGDSVGISCERSIQIIVRISVVTGYKISFDLSQFTQEERTLLAGRTIINGIDSSNIDGEVPNFSVMFKAKKSNKKFKYYNYPKVQFSEPTEDFNGSVKPTYQIMTLEGNSIPRIYPAV
jgi:hypothetical protein